MRHTFRVLLPAFVMLVAAISFAFAASPDPVSTASKTMTIGLDTKTVTNTWEAYFQDSFEWYSTDNGVHWIAEQANGNPAVQITQSRNLLNEGVNGLIVSAQDANAAVPIVNIAMQDKVPVFTADADINSPNVVMYVGFSGVRAGEQLGNRVVQYLKTKYDGQVKGTVLDMLGPLGGASAQQRNQGFMNVISQYPDVKVLTAEGNFQEAPGETAAADVLRAHPSIDAIYSANGPMAVGAVRAEQSLGLDPSKVFTVTIDATPSVLQMIKQGLITEALDQPAGFYVPIAEHYLELYLKDGPSALPKVGQTITANELNFNTGVKHDGFLPWANDNQVWGPAKITTEDGHLWFQTNAVLVTKANADAPYLWGNVKIPGF